MVFGKRTTGEPCFVGSSVHCDFCGEEFDPADEEDGIQLKPPANWFDSLSAYHGGLDLCANCAVFIGQEITKWKQGLADV